MSSAIQSVGEPSSLRRDVGVLTDDVKRGFDKRNSSKGASDDKVDVLFR